MPISTAPASASGVSNGSPWVPAHQLGAAVAAYGGGLSRSLAGSYLPAFYTAGIACLLASLAALTARTRRAPALA